MTIRNIRWCAILSLLSGAGLIAQTQQYSISTVVGGGLLPSTPVATNVAIGAPFSIATDRHGNAFIGLGYGVVKMDSTGSLTPVAGTGTAGESGDGGPALKAQISSTMALAVDPVGNLYIADAGYGRVRKVDTNGIITTIAGNGATTSYNNGAGDGGLAISAPLFYPYQLAADAAGNVYIGEWNTARIRKVSPDGIITTFAGTGVGGFSGDGGSAIEAQIGEPWGLAIDPSGVIWFSDDEAGGDECSPCITHIRKITPDGIISTIA